MDVLIMTCGTGGGHKSAAEALKEKFVSQGDTAVVVDPYLIRDSRLSGLVNNAYIKLVQKHPKAFGTVYKVGEAYDGLRIKSPVYLFNKIMRNTLWTYMESHRFDAVVVTHLYPGEMLLSMRKSGYRVPPEVFVVTDYTCIPFTGEPECDAYVIPSPELIPEFTSHGIPRDRIRPLGIPVSDQFCTPVRKDEAKRMLGLDPELKYYLIMGGSMGAGNIMDTVQAMCSVSEADPEKRGIVVCGSRRELREKIEKRFGKKIVVLGHTENIAAYLMASEAVLTKAGGLSITEAASVGIPMVFLETIPGCETMNMRFFCSHGMGIQLGRPSESLEAAIDVVSNPAFRDAMIENQHKYIPSSASEKICGLVREIAGNNSKNVDNRPIW
ncbi:MAG: MGDG synthase family glycosyltransferase [Oscillospiraceae bacterium]|jgi:processive 1,2-diacylglycerol beta-glucosyltransferase